MHTIASRAGIFFSHTNIMISPSNAFSRSLAIVIQVMRLVFPAAILVSDRLFPALTHWLRHLMIQVTIRTGTKVFSFCFFLNFISLFPSFSQCKRFIINKCVNLSTDLEEGRLYLVFFLDALHPKSSAKNIYYFFPRFSGFEFWVQRAICCFCFHKCMMDYAYWAAIRWLWCD